MAATGMRAAKQMSAHAWCVSLYMYVYTVTVSGSLGSMHGWRHETYIVYGMLAADTYMMHDDSMGQ